MIKYKASKVDVALVVEERELVDQNKRLVALEMHFAAPENGNDASVQELLEIGGLHGHGMFTMAEPAEGFIKARGGEGLGRKLQQALTGRIALSLSLLFFTGNEEGYRTSARD